MHVILSLIIIIVIIFDYIFHQMLRRLT